MSLFYCATSNWIQYSRCGLTSIEIKSLIKNTCFLSDRTRAFEDVDDFNSSTTTVPQRDKGKKSLQSPKKDTTSLFPRLWCYTGAISSIFRFHTKLQSSPVQLFVINYFQIAKKLWTLPKSFCNITDNTYLVFCLLFFFLIKTRIKWGYWAQPKTVGGTLECWEVRKLVKCSSLQKEQLKVL